MKSTLVMAAAMAGASLLAPQSAAAQIGATCDRACLTGMMDQYFDALIAHDSGQLPLSNDIKYTENGVTLAITDGLWQTVRAAPSYRFDIVDVEAGEIGTLGVVTEGTNENFFSTRIKVENRRITEIENLVVRSISGPSGFGSPEPRSEPFPIFNEIEPVETRSSRSELIAAANAYFTGLDSEVTGANVPFDPDCQRLENGGYMANSPTAEPGSMQALGCKAQFDTGFQVIVTNIRARRFPIVDEEHGLVYALGFFDHAGAVPEYGRPDGTVQPVSGPFSQPFSFVIAEVFKIRDGRIRQIEAVLTTVPYGMPSGW
ncbi:hypothetical protein GCM10009127_09700 [Alteraurantiacibacter aestuarii]|uniref:DUF8021 domain-containing protein n=1 Tax=Alteraurantiacibacter aestuarii TaxID=650004 RepID=A0A844ZNY2_9SPHN|nr:hypothetical protein [Alteraurantiacibacter aestuarii]MXO87359.1 hypothetical protein [Alteraurantiacibacter aestuarii]